jgi:tetratricopeptide (TPR) repeat protein
LLANLLLATGEYDRAEMRFRAIENEGGSAKISAALGEIALRKGDMAGARRAWKRAIEQGIADARLCYRYAILADQAGLAADDIRPALERAVQLQPDFDDAHYQLALLEKAAGHYEAALREFLAMRDVSRARAFAYWLAIANSYNELDRREEAEGAAKRAIEHAANREERARAVEQIRMAQTDLGVQFARDEAGNLQMVTTRVPHAASDWNPFIEPGDDIRRVEGALREVECGKETTIRVEVSGKLLRLTIPDLQHVQMRHAPSDFVCGAQERTPVAVDYARTPKGPTEGVVRGMGF